MYMYSCMYIVLLSFVLDVCVLCKNQAVDDVNKSLRFLQYQYQLSDL